MLIRLFLLMKNKKKIVFKYRYITYNNHSTEQQYTSDLLAQCSSTDHTAQKHCIAPGGLRAKVRYDISRFKCRPSHEKVNGGTISLSLNITWWIFPNNAGFLEVIDLLFVQIILVQSISSNSNLT